MKILTAAAVLALMASPALAQSSPAQEAGTMAPAAGAAPVASTIDNSNSQAQATGNVQPGGTSISEKSTDSTATNGAAPMTGAGTDAMSTSSTMVPPAGAPSTGASTARSGTAGASSDEVTTPSGGAVPGQTPN